MDGNVAIKIEAFFSKYPLKHYVKNQIIIYANEDPSCIFHLINGQVREYDITDSGEEVVVNAFKPPAYFPLSYAINHTHNFYYFETLTAVDARVAPAADVVTFLQTNADVMYDLISRVFSGTIGMQRRMAHMMSGGGTKRVLYELVVECKRFGSKQADGTYILTMHEDELAHRAGLARETVNRELVKLKRQKLLDINRQDLIVKDLNGIENLIGTGL